MLQGEHSAILLTFIKLPFVVNVLVLAIFEWPLKTGFTVYGIPLSKILYINVNTPINVYTHILWYWGGGGGGGS